MQNNNSGDNFGGFIAIIIWGLFLLLGIYGIYVAFMASFWIGVVHLVFPPLPVITGVLHFIFDVNLPEGILSAF